MPEMGEKRAVSDWILPGMTMFILFAGVWKRLPVYDVFVGGAKEGMGTGVRILPNLAAMLCAITLMQASGLMELLCSLCAPALRWLGLPGETAPLLIIRPLSGSGALAVVEQIMETCGPDSREGLIACTIMGSSETIFYTVCVYMSASERRDTGYAVPCALAGSLAGAWMAGMLF